MARIFPGSWKAQAWDRTEVRALPYSSGWTGGAVEAVVVDGRAGAAA